MARWDLRSTARRLLLLVLGGVAALVLGGCDPSLVLVVTTTADTADAVPGDGVCADDDGECSLRAAIQEANAQPGGLVEVQLAAGEAYHLTRVGSDEDAASTGDLDVAASILLTGNGATIDAGGLDRVLDVRDGGALIAAGVTVTGGVVRESSDGDPVGGGIRAAGNLGLVGTTVRANHVVGDLAVQSAGGGGIFAERIDLLDSTVSDNTVTVADPPEPDVAALGAGLWVTGQADIDRSVVTRNTAAGCVPIGAGIMSSRWPLPDLPEDVTGPRAFVSVVDSVVSHNTAVPTTGTAGGGGLSAEDGEIVASTVTDNEVGGDFGIGGGILTKGDLVVVDSVVQRNHASQGGGGVTSFWAWDGAATHLEVTRSSVVDNTTGYRGAGIAVLSAPAGGGGPYEPSTADISDSTVSGNVAEAGAGLYLQESPSIVIEHSTVSGNTALGDGDPVTSGDGLGGGIFASRAAVSLGHVTVADNAAVLGGSGLAMTSDAVVELAGTVVAEQASGLGCESVYPVGPAVVTSLGHNADADGSCGLTDPTDLSGVATLLGPLADNGGPTETHLPAGGSPLVDVIAPPFAGCGTGTDQRGLPTPQGAACDIGAVDR